MTKGKAYLVGYSTGDYETYRRVTVFTTLSKSKAQKWVRKFNRIIREWKEWLSQFEEVDGIVWLKNEYIGKWFNRWRRISEISKAYCEEIELR